MKDDKEDFVGYIKLTGKGVSDGLIDASLASELLAGIDKSLRFYINTENPVYAKSKYSLPIKIEQGSIIVTIVGITAIAGTAYLAGVANTVGKNDVGEKTSKEVFKSAINSMKKTVKIAKHVGKLGKKNVENVKFDKKDNQVIGIPNSKSEYLYVKKSEFDKFFSTPPKLYEPMAKNVSSDVDLIIGSKDEKNEIEEEEIDNTAKPIFSKVDESNEDSETILPELVDNMYVELEGEVTRGNERSNTIGFEYKGHILTCDPEEGSITEYKEELFGKAIIKGRISRNYKDPARAYQDKRPRIIFDKLIALRGGDTQIKLI